MRKALEISDYTHEISNTSVQLFCISTQHSRKNGTKNSCKDGFSTGQPAKLLILPEIIWSKSKEYGTQEYGTKKYGGEDQVAVYNPCVYVPFLLWKNYEGLLECQVAHCVFSAFQVVFLLACYHYLSSYLCSVKLPWNLAWILIIERLSCLQLYLHPAEVP